MHTLILTPDQTPDESIQTILETERFSFTWVDHLDTTRMPHLQREILVHSWQPFLLMDAATLLRYFREIADPKRKVHVFVAREINLSGLQALDVVSIDPDILDLPFAPAA
jgi:hypothetical protein